MKEYEYSFKVNDLDKYIDYCQTNGYELFEETNQLRTIYRNRNKTIARVTINEKEGLTTKKLDFKDDILSDSVLIERRESLPIEVSNDEAVESILDFLNFKKDNTLKRVRIVYKKDNVTFELDTYETPEKTFVVAIEGEKEEVDKVYEEVMNI